MKEGKVRKERGGTKGTAATMRRGGGDKGRGKGIIKGKRGEEKDSMKTGWFLASSPPPLSLSSLNNIISLIRIHSFIRVKIVSSLLLVFKIPPPRPQLAVTWVVFF